MKNLVSYLSESLNINEANIYNVLRTLGSGEDADAVKDCIEAYCDENNVEIQNVNDTITAKLEEFAQDFIDNDEESEECVEIKNFGCRFDDTLIVYYLNFNSKEYIYVYGFGIAFEILR